MLQEFPMYAYIPANDVARARKFYEGKIGLKPADEIAGGVTYKFADNTACFLYPAAPSAGTSKASQAFWTVDNLERVMAELRARGVEFEDYDEPDFKTVNGVAEGGGAKAAWFKDTEGNIMALVEDVR
jgi:predicted enzyme related to lactoylglutathione lyase